MFCSVINNFLKKQNKELFIVNKIVNNKNSSWKKDRLYLLFNSFISSPKVFCLVFEDFSF